MPSTAEGRADGIDEADGIGDARCHAKCHRNPPTSQDRLVPDRAR